MWAPAPESAEEYSGLSIGVENSSAFPADSYSNLNPEGPTFTPQAAQQAGSAQQPYSGPQPGGIGGMGGYSGADGGSSGGMGGWYGNAMGSEYNDEGVEQGIAQDLPEGSYVTVPALSLRQVPQLRSWKLTTRSSAAQWGPSLLAVAYKTPSTSPLASLVLYGVKQIENRNRPTLKQIQGPLALHVSHKEEPYGSPIVTTAINILRRRHSDDQIQALFQLPQTMAQGKGCIVGIVDVECTWPADLFNEVEQAQLTEQAVCPVSGTFLTQLRNPRWLKYPVRTAGSNRLWQVQIPLDALPEGSEMDANGNLLPLSSRDRPPLYQPGSCANLIDGDDMGLGLLGGDMVRQLQSADGAGEKEKRLKKLQKALRQIGELKEKQAAGAVLEKTQEEKIVREVELRAELADLMVQDESGEL